MQQSTTRAAASRGTVLVALSACGFASIPIFVTLATRSGTPLLEVLVGRYALASAILGSVAWATGTRRLQREGLRVLFIIGIVQALIAYTSLLALQYITAGALSFLFYTYPAWIAIIARVRHSEPLTRSRLLALTLSLVGVAIMVGSTAAVSLDWRGIALALGSALIYALYVPLIAELQRPLTPESTAAYFSVGTAIIFLLAKVMSGGMSFHLTPVAMRSIAGLGVVSTAMAFLLFLRGLSIIGPLRTAIVSTIEPFCTALLGAWFLSQPLSSSTLMGGVFIAAAVTLLQLSSSTAVRRKKMLADSSNSSYRSRTPPTGVIHAGSGLHLMGGPMVRRVAMVVGIVFLLVGVLGLVSTGGMQMGADPTPAMILGIFPTNLLHNIVHILFGVWGIVASRSFSGAKMYAQVGGVVYIILAICGLLIPSTFGLLPNGGNDVWLHAVLGLVLAWAGFMAKEGMGATAPAPGAMKM